MNHMEKENPLISVIVPIYNNAGYLYRCIGSVLKQSYDNLEIILVDDGSTDGSNDICDEYLVKDNRVKVIHKRNEGTVSARNCGLKNAQGQLVSFIDGDDWIREDMYEQLIEIYFQNNCPECISSGLIIEDIQLGKKEILLDEISEKRYEKEDIVREILPVLIYNPDRGEAMIRTSVCTKLIDKVLAQKAMEYMDYSISMGEDGAYVYFLLSCCESLLITHKAFYHYEVHADSQNYKFTEESFLKLVRLHEVMTKGLEQLIGNNKNILWQINYYIRRYLRYIVEQNLKIKIEEYFFQFPFAKCERGSTVVIYGAGKVGKSYVKSLKKTKYVNRIIWTDKNYRNLEKEIQGVISIEKALDNEYDHFVIAIESEELAEIVRKDLLKRGVKSEKIIWEEPIRIELYD